MKTRGRTQWRDAVSRIAPLLPRERLHPGVVAWADQRPKGERWAVALSGGSDSVALLLALLAHWPGRAGGLVALHFAHRLRGAESTADARFCKRMCAELGVAFVGLLPWLARAESRPAFKWATGSGRPMKARTSTLVIGAGPSIFCQVTDGYPQT